MRIGQLAERLGVSGDTVRFYERAGWLPSAPRQDNGYRDYREEDVEHLRLLIDLRRMELPLDMAARFASCHSGHCDQATASAATG
jgi:DNA-binding transcriptional MerR regulator